MFLCGCFEVLLKVWINGEEQDVPAGLTARTLLAHLGIPSDRVAIEYNHEVLPRPRWEATHIQPNDRFEIVHLVGGG